ncbi:contactin-5 isoform X3 [Hydra vulgaris]|uniref:Contactin-5 isoform X3 n=1 Tax=Hydra vulgaris TaxID=6087 RepID=A0ABM4BEZ4_HYDVU
MITWFVFLILMEATNCSNISDFDLPYFVIKPSPKLAVEFLPLMIDCLIMGNPAPTISWIKNNITIIENDRIHILSNGSLLILKSTLTDKGLYVCSGENVHGSIQSIPPIKILVAYIAFDFLENPISQKKKVGESITFNCVPPIHYPDSLVVNWFKDFNVIFPNRRTVVLLNNSLTISNVQTTDEGMYFCQATNKVAMVYRTSKKANLEVLELPTFISQNKNISIRDGDSLLINCSVRGKPKPNITIYRVVQNKMIVLSMSETYTAQLVSILDQGVYVCFASNEVGYTKHLIYVMLYTSAVFLTHPSNVTANIRESIILNCKVNGYPYPNIYWYYENQKLSFGNVSTPDLLYIKNITKMHAGFYYCVASNLVGNITSNKGFLRVLVPPMIELEEKVYANISSLLKISCMAYGDPSVSIIWKAPFNVTPFIIFSNESASNDLFHTVSSFTIYNTSLNDSGIYKCIAKNTAGSISKEVSVIIQGYPDPPVINSLKAISSDSIQVSWNKTFDGYSPITLYIIEYTLNNQSWNKMSVSHDMFSVLIINLKPYTSYYFRLKSKNFVGDSIYSHIAEMKTLEGVPDIGIYKIQSIDIFSTSFKISFNLETVDSANGVILGYIVNCVSSVSKVTINTNSTSVVIEKLTPYTEYQLYIAIINKVGVGKFSYLYTAFTKIGVPDAPSNLQVVAVNSTAVKLSWLPPKKMNGPIKYYEVCISHRNATMVKTTKEVFILIYTLMPNSTYVAFVVAFTEAGQGNSSEKLQFQTGLISTPLTASAGWLDREYLIVIIPVSALSVLLLFVLLLIFIVRIFHSKYNNKKVAELDKSDRNKNSDYLVRHINDLVWDGDDDSGITGSDDTIDSNNNSEIQHASSITQSFNKKKNFKKIPDTNTQYFCVEPYQGMVVETSPLVKLKGLNVKFERYLSDFEPEANNDEHSITLNSLNNPPSLSNLDLVESETDFSDGIFNENFQSF